MVKGGLPHVLHLAVALDSDLAELAEGVMGLKLQPRVWIPLSLSQFDSYIWGLDFGLGLGLRLFNIIKSNLGFLMTSLLTSVLEMLCMSGNVLSGIIAFNVWRIQEKSFINRMFFLYFAIDCVIGATDPYFLFKLFRERSVLLSSVTSVLHMCLLDMMVNSNRNKTVNYFWLLGCFGHCREAFTTLQWWA